MPYKNPEDRKKHYQRNKDAMQAKSKKYRLDNRERMLSLSRNRDYSLKGRLNVLRCLMKKEGVSSDDLLWRPNFYAALIQDSSCHYCLGALNATGCGLDRISNVVGHVGFNVLSCCRQCNRIKGNDISYEEMMVLAPALRKIRTERVQSSSTC